MNKKVFQAPIELKEDGKPGEFSAVFSTFNVIDHDQDVTLPGAFSDGQKVRISYWGHRWHDLPVGRGVVHADDEKAWVDGMFFLDTEAGMETYKTVKNLAELQEWSYGFDIIESKSGQFEGDDVRFLSKMTVHEVSPVLLGAGIGTQTVAIKGTSQEDPEEPEAPEEKSEAGENGEDPHDESPEDGSDSETAASGKESGLTPEVVQTDTDISLELVR